MCHLRRVMYYRALMSHCWWHQGALFRMAAHLSSSRDRWIHAAAAWLLPSEPESVSCSHWGEQTGSSPQSVCNHTLVSITRNNNLLKQFAALMDRPLLTHFFPEEVVIGPNHWLLLRCWVATFSSHSSLVWLVLTPVLGLYIAWCVIIEDICPAIQDRHIIRKDPSAKLELREVNIHMHSSHVNTPSFGPCGWIWLSCCYR